MFRRKNNRKRKTGLIILAIFLSIGGIIYSWLIGLVGLPINNGWLYYDFFIEKSKKHAFLVFIPNKIPEPSTVLITIAHPADYRLFSKSIQLFENIMHIHRIKNISNLTKEYHPIIVRYLYYWNDEKQNASWLKGSHQDPNVTKHIFNASDNFKAFVAKIKDAYNPSRIFGFGFSFEGTAILALAEQNPEFISGIATLSSPTVSIALPQLKENIERISNIPLYFVYGEEDEIQVGKRMIDREKSFRNELERVVKDYEYIIIPGVGHFLPDYVEKNAIDWLFKKI